MTALTVTKEMSPFAQLQQMEHLCHLYAAGLPAQRDSQAEWAGVGFRLGARRFISALDDVSEVLHEPKYTLIPGVKSWVKGVANVRGRLLPVIDLCAFLQIESRTSATEQRVVVVDAEGIFVGVTVDEVFGMRHFEIENYQEQFDDSEASLNPYLMGEFADEARWTVFSFCALAQTPAFLDVVA
ncbi:chemotaxis protein CheW [Pseudomonas sp. F1_0610]|uniref:chemotaxis protein CheW n=1 Tax=Pseudomonas sp. F1_0610 TaxID=3114284 RepID=UPI0039C4DD25